MNSCALCSSRLLGARSGAGLRKNQQSSPSTSYVGRWLRLSDPKEQFYTKQDNFEHPSNLGGADARNATFEPIMQIEEEISRGVGVPVTITTRNVLHPLMKDAIERDAIRVL